VTELAPLGALDTYLREKEGRLGTRGLLNFCVNISKGMAFLVCIFFLCGVRYVKGEFEKRRRQRQSYKSLTKVVMKK